MSISELYRFTEGVSVWTYTSADTSQVHSAETYEPITIGRNEPEMKAEMSKASVTVNVALTSVLGQRWLSAVLEAPVFLTIFKKVDATVGTFWKGRLVSVKPDPAKVSLIFESAFTYLRRTGLSVKFQRTCPHVHYGRGCNLDKELFAVAAVVDSVTAAVVSCSEADALPDGHFIGGMLRTSTGSLRFIVNHVGPLLTLSRTVPLTVGELIDIFPGCDRSIERCDTTFSNLANNGSFPFIPIKNPYKGSSIV
jgi:Phage conserved hypothetical protein BR0599